MKRTYFFILILVMVSALDILCLFHNEQWNFLVMYSQRKKLVAACLLILVATVYSIVLDWKDGRNSHTKGSE
ncbi:hypothetical protein [Paenibacillus glycanilyticus]|uniref:hypothetical protein n=1 Tax=Paenibacillus glycanilyticus TaxID=126569 RepID=UPI000FD95C88|nr:hypothetical protein [Paenibacillus glycanilyticus]